MNNSAREMMAAIRRSYVRQPWYAPGGTIVRASANTITIADDSKVTNYADYYTVGARVRIETTGDYVTGYVASSLYEDPTSTITFNLDAGADLPATITDVYVGLSPEDVQGVAGPNLLGCIIGFTEEGTKIGAGLLLANGSKFNPSLYPDLAQLYYISENTYRYGQELVGDVYWPKLPDVRGYFPRYADDRIAPEGDDPDTRIDPSAPRTVGSTQNDAIKELTGSISGITTHGLTCDGIFKAGTAAGTNVTGSGSSWVEQTAELDISEQTDVSTETRSKNIAMVGVVVAYGGVISSGLADVTELETFCTAERVRAEDAATAANNSAMDASSYAIAASGHSTAASNSATLAQQWATKTDGLVASTDYSAKYYANQSSASASSASSSADLAHAWATSSTVVESGQYGASYYALRAANYASGAETARDTARNWATKTDGPVADSNYSAKYYANQASSSATAASNSADQAAAIVAQLGTVLTYKGSVATYADLPATGNKTGDVWNVLADGKNYAWDGTDWDDFGGAVTVALSACTDVSLTSLTDGQVLIWDSVAQKWKNGTIDALPSQAGQGGKFLKTNGTNASWDNVESLPSQTGNAGKSLYTDGTDTSWKVTRDPNTYRSLSSAQATALLNDGLYNDEEVDNGEIFTCDDGAIKKYVKEDLGVGIDASDYSDTRIPCNKTVIENGVPVLYATIGTDTTIFLKSTDYGKTWGSVSSNRGSLSCYKQRMFYENGVFYVMRTSDGDNMYLDVSVDNMQTWSSTYVGRSSWYYANSFYIAVNSTYIVVGYSYDGTYRQFRAPLSDLSSFTEVSDWDIRQVYVFNDLFVCESKYSSDASTWTSNNMPSTRNGMFFKNNKMYVQKNSTPAVLYESSDGMVFTSVGTYSGANAFDSYATFDTIDEVYAYNQASPQVYYSTKSDLLNWTKISDDFMRDGEYCDLWFVSPEICFEVSQTSDTRRGIAGVKYNRYLELLSSTKLPDIASAGNGIKFETKGNAEFTKVGSPVISDGVASGFSSSNYLIADYMFNPSTNDWEIGGSFTLPDSNVHYFFGTENNETKGVLFGVENGEVMFAWSEDGSNWQNPLSSGVSVTAYQKYYYYAKYTETDSVNHAGTYEIGVSTDKENWTTQTASGGYIQSSSKLYIGACWDMTVDDRYCTGSMDLNDEYVKIGSDVDWTPYQILDKPAITLDVGSGTPNSSTVGYVGKISVDSSGNAYICTGVSGSTYTWRQISLS